MTSIFHLYFVCVPYDVSNPKFSNKLYKLKSLQPKTELKYFKQKNIAAE